MTANRYDFRSVEEGDLPMIRDWITAPHAAAWWGDPDEEIASIREHIESISVEPIIVELDGKPIAYLQSYDPHLEEDHPYQDQPFGTIGLDLTLAAAELTGMGHGSALLRQFVAELFDEGAPRVIIDPDPTNARAIRAYEKAGFRAFDTRTTIYGPALMMAINADEWDAAP